LSPSWSADGRRQHGLSEWRRGLRGRRAACEARQAWKERGERFHGGGGATSVAYSAVTGGCVEAQAVAELAKNFSWGRIYINFEWCKC